jgi:hypothetical protein
MATGTTNPDNRITPLTDDRKAALLPEEDPAEYEGLRARFVAAVEPRDAIEELWVDDVAELTYEMRRLRHIRMRIVALARPEALERLSAETKPRRLAVAWSEGRDAEEYAILTQMKPTPEDITAKAFELRLAAVERISGMIAQAETRRNIALREIDRRRDALAARLRTAAAIEDAEFEEIGQAPAVPQVGNGRSRS